MNARERQSLLYRRDMLRVVKLFNPAGIKHRRHAWNLYAGILDGMHGCPKYSPAVSEISRFSISKIIAQMIFETV